MGISHVSADYFRHHADYLPDDHLEYHNSTEQQGVQDISRSYGILEMCQSDNDCLKEHQQSSKACRTFQERTGSLRSARATPSISFSRNFSAHSLLNPSLASHPATCLTVSCHQSSESGESFVHILHIRTGMEGRTLKLCSERYRELRIVCQVTRNCEKEE